MPNGDAAKRHTPAHGFPADDLPLLFVDLITSVSNGAGFVKFYAARIDPSIEGDGSTKVTPMAQIVMPHATFANTAVFFEAQLEILMMMGSVERDAVEQMRATFRKARDDA